MAGSEGEGVPSVAVSSPGSVGWIGPGVWVSSPGVPGVTSPSTGVLSSTVVSVCVVFKLFGTGDPVKSSASSSALHELSYLRFLYLMVWQHLTKFEEIHPSLVSTNVEVFFEEPSPLEAQLRKVVATIVAEKDKATWLQHL